MSETAERHLDQLADPSATARLAGLGFDWKPIDGQACAALRFTRRVRNDSQSRPLLIGFIGGASSGKSTLFNSLVGAELSRISAHAHETLGPIAAIPSGRLDDFDRWSGDQLIFPGLDYKRCDGADGQPQTGKVGTLCGVDLQAEALVRTTLIDLPDVTSKMSADEGSTAQTLLPWFDGLVVIVDEERWFDATVFEETTDYARNFGPRVWIVFNRTEHTNPLSEQDHELLARHAEQRHAAAWCLSPYQPGRGFRPLSDETRQQVLGWLNSGAPEQRSAALTAHVQRKCAAVMQVNVERGEQFANLCRNIEKEIGKVQTETSLSFDLLTTEERLMLGKGRRLIPLFDLYRSVERWATGFLKRQRDAGIDFDKQTNTMAGVLRRNLEHRFNHAADRINRLTADSGYLGDVSWQANWTVPAIDEQEWANRIRAHLDAWKQEASKQSRRGDVTALALGMPLLLADLLFLGGAGLTWSWATAWVAGFLGGKSLTQFFQKSPAFQAYQTEVRAYQALIRDALAEQWDRNLTAMPRRHLPMTDPLAEAVIHWSSPARR